MMFVWTAYGTKTEVIVTEPLSSPELGALLPSESPRDELVVVETAPAEDGTGTAFAINNTGRWMTARHVVDGCKEVGLRVNRGRFMRVNVKVFENSDLAVLQSDWTRATLPADLDTRRQIGEIGYFFGFPQGKPGEVVGSLIARNRMKVRGRYTNQEAILAWSELGRSRNLVGSLGGMSGAPVLDKDGEIIGVVTAEAPRRGRIYSVAPKYLRGIITEPASGTEPLSLDNYSQSADKLRRDRRVAKIICLVD